MSNGQPTERRSVGIYLRALSERTYGTPKAAAKKAADNGLAFVALLACWQYSDKTILSNGRDPALIARYAEAFAAAGVHPWIWGYPWAGREQEYVDRLRAVSAVAPIAGWLHDPELGYKWNAGTRATVLAAAGRLRGLCDSAAIAQGVTSYGMARGQPYFPWHLLGGLGFGSPQLYTVGPADVDRGIAQWRERGWTEIVPSVPLYGRNSGARLHDYLSCFVDGQEDVSGLLFWSWPQASPDEWRIMARWSEWLERGMCCAHSPAAGTSPPLPP